MNLKALCATGLILSMVLPVGSTAFANSDVISLWDSNGGITTSQSLSTTGSAIVLDKSHTDSKKPVKHEKEKPVFSAKAKSELEKPVAYTPGERVTLPNGSNLYREGYRFVGWNTDPDADSGFFEIVMEDDTVLYAIWVAEKNKSTTGSSLHYNKPSGVTESGLLFDTNDSFASTESALFSNAY